MKEFALPLPKDCWPYRCEPSLDTISSRPTCVRCGHIIWSTADRAHARQQYLNAPKQSHGGARD